MKYILALLNSSTLNFAFAKSSANSNVNGYEIDNLPIILTDEEQQACIVSLVDRILAAKRTDPEVDTSVLETEIDRAVYSLYDLTPEEVAIVEAAIGH